MKVQRFVASFALLLIALLMGSKAGVLAAGRTVPVGTQRAGSTDQALVSVQARVVAVAIPGAGAISPVGRFLPGGPIHDSAPFAAFTEPGRVLDPNRIFVGSNSNFGAPLADSQQAPGALLSIDPNGDSPLIVPSGFAAADGQVSALDGRLQLFSAQSPAFRNGINTPGAVTADLAGVSNPHGLSLNNGFGRIWPANVPAGMAEPATESILDPSGVPLASAPDQVSGGVFAADLTDRRPEPVLAGGLTTGAVGTALLGRSPDKSTRAVFAIVLADGSLVQAHTEQGVDGLAPAGTVTPLTSAAASGAGDLRVGIVWNFEPVRTLFMSDPLANAVVTLNLDDDGRIFRPGAVARLTSPSFNVPIGLAPANPETEDTDQASNTTLFENSDIYVANRGDNTIVRIRQDGSVVAVRQVVLAGGQSLGDAWLTGIAVSPDSSRIWVTTNGPLPGFPGQDGAVLEVPAFGAS
jgi:hypothetical protein